MKKVSIIIPVYNVEKYLRQCLDSVVNQTFTDIEIICVDDGSTDGSLSILKEYAARDARIIVVEQLNKGAGAARNNGISHACGEYLAFVDPDDFIDPSLITDCIETAEGESSDVVVFKHLKFDSETNAVLEEAPFPEKLRSFLSSGRKSASPDDVCDFLFTSVGHAVWDKFFRRAFIISEKIVFQELRRTNDLYFVDMALLKAKKITFLDKVLYHYRKGIESTTTNASLAGHCFIGYGAIKDYLLESGRYTRFARDFIKKVSASLRYEIRTIRDEVGRLAAIPRLVAQYNEVLPIDEILRFRKSLPTSLLDVLPEGECMAVYKHKKSAPLDNPSRFPDEIPVSIIIPVYNAYEALCDLTESLFKHTASIHEVIFINDASPDTRIRPYLESICSRHPNARLVNNEENHGFSYNINLGASLTTRDFVILNTDTLVPDKWIPRLFAPISAFPENTGSVTPMSSDALEFTLPEVGLGGMDFVERFGYEAIDRAVSSVVTDPEHDLAWRGLGFAMAISRKAWQAVGPFAHEVFGRGYHEETDWCFRARRLGFENRVAPNLFVPHQHNGSFSVAEKKVLLEHNFAALRTRNPEAFGPSVKQPFMNRAKLLRRACARALVEFGVGYFQLEKDLCPRKKSKTRKLEKDLCPRKKSKTRKLDNVWARMVQCYRDEGLVYTAKRILVLGRRV